MTGGEFICTKCRIHGSPYTVCYVQNSSSAFPYYIVRDLKCPRGLEEPNWRHVEGLDMPFLPHEGHGTEVKTILSQEKIREEKGE